ncbi:unnamed protein product [Arctia plantaginis]|uniref:Uncharacterized protein n=1 Tax=Arctia plantaginis TaxID=874455 RepID=A0A8S1AT64_ARCPL|nr:unnamed protein product [Arctia plantaginis]
MTKTYVSHGNAKRYSFVVAKVDKITRTMDLIMASQGSTHTWPGFDRSETTIETEPITAPNAVTVTIDSM